MRIFINHSPERDLKRLKGVGPVLAARIIKRRQQRPFRDPEDVWHRVTGISERTVESWDEQQGLVVIFAVQKVSGQSAFTRVLFVLFIAALTAAILLVSIPRIDLLFPEMKSKSDPRPLNATANHTIYFECMDDRDCEPGYQCFPGKLHPLDKPFDISGYTNADNYWVDSKFGLERLRVAYAHEVDLYDLESGKRCWSTTAEIGADCGDHVHQICDAKNNLTCVYGKCRETNDAYLVHSPVMKGHDFTSRRKRFCNNLGICLSDHGASYYSAVDPTGYLSLEAEEYWKKRLELAWEGPEGNSQMRAMPIPIHDLFNKKFTFPKEFGVHLIMDTNLTSDAEFDTQADAEKYYIEAVSKASAIFEDRFGFSLRVKSFCWAKGYFWDDILLNMGSVFRPFRRETNINIIVFVRWKSYSEWNSPSDSGKLGLTKTGGIWHNQAKHKDDRGPALIRFWHLENYMGLDQKAMTIAHEVAHTIGAQESWEITKELGGPFFGTKFEPFDCGDEVGTVMSYCNKSEFRFLNATEKIIHEFMNIRDHFRKQRILSVYGKTEQVPPLINDPLVGLFEPLDAGICKKVRENCEDWISGNFIDFEDQEDETPEDGHKEMARHQRYFYILAAVVSLFAGAFVGFLRQSSHLSKMQRFEATICLSKSSAEELRKLRGVGPKIAERIVENAPYEDWSDFILRVQGLGQQTLDDWKADPRIIV